MLIEILPWNGQPKYTALTWNDVQVGIQAGDDILVDGILATVTNVSGGYLVNGCPLNVLFGAQLSLAQAQVLVGIAPMLNSKGLTSCLSVAQSMIGTTTVSTPTPGTSSPGVSNATTPASTTSDTVAQLTQPTSTQLSNAATAAAVSPSVPTALPQGTGSAVGGQMLSQVYRFILQVSGGYATGANLQGCSQTNSAMCDPQFFTTLQDAINYAIQQGQIPYQVLSSSDPWALMAGTLAINPAQIYNADGTLGGSSISMTLNQTVGGTGIPLWAILAAGVAAYFILKK